MSFQVQPAPLGELPASLAQHPIAELEDQVALLGQRHELSGGDRAALRVLPAQQRFDPGDPQPLGIELGLEVEAQLILAEGQAKVAFELEARDGLDAHLGGEALDALEAMALGAVEGAIGLV